MKSLINLRLVLAVSMLILSGAASAATDTTQTLGYYRFPALHDTTIVFSAEGDLWKIGIGGGVARRMTTHPGQEIYPAISPDGATVAFTAQYEGPLEVYTMPIDGGLPTRRTFKGGSTRVVNWTPDGEIIYATRNYSTLPNTQLASIDLSTNQSSVIPLEQASDGTTDPMGKILYFTRQPFQGSYTKRYKGGTAQNIWKYAGNGSEATPLTSDYDGTSRQPMWWQNRLYFISDRDGTLNIWSMDENGSDLKQHTFNEGWDVKTATLDNGRIVYESGADLYLLDIAAGESHLIPIRLSSDFDQMREKWLKKPFDYLTSAHISPDGDRVVLTARGQVFTAPAGQGRLVRNTRNEGVRYRQAYFMPDGKNLLVLSDESGEVEFWEVPADGVGPMKQLTQNGKILRFYGIPSPDGKMIAYTEKDNRLWIYDIEKKTFTQIKTIEEGEVSDLAWSPDSKWLAFSEPALNWFQQIKIYNIQGKTITALTTDRYNSSSPAWSPDGKWLYFLSDRSFVSPPVNPWSSRQAEPFYERKTKLYMIPLVDTLRSPFAPDDELVKAEKKVSEEKKDDKKSKDKDKEGSKDSLNVIIDTVGIMDRLIELPLPPGNYGGLSVTDKHMYWISQELTPERVKTLIVAKIANKDVKADTVVSRIEDYEMSLDRKKLMIRKTDAVYVTDADGSKPSALEKSQVNLGDWTFPFDPKMEWRQMFVEAWRLERDYFYDPNMQGVDWKGVLNKYLPLVDRVTDRDELSDLLGEMIGELSALHMYVFGGDARRGDEKIYPGTLGAELTRDEKAGGYRIDHIYKSDPDEPDQQSPLARPGMNIKEGDIITSVNGVAALSIAHPDLLLRQQAGEQVLLEIKSSGSGKTMKVIVNPITQSQDRNLRYNEWDYTRRLRVEEKGEGQIGYVHLRDMGLSDYAQWARDFYPVYLRQGLIVDVRHNGGGNIESWILEKLMRKAWAYWQSRTGQPYSDMQYAFTGHMVVLCDEFTASDGELFTEGFRRLGLGRVIGTRTWGGEIWLSFSNALVDKGIASAAESGVFGPKGKWLIEGWGVEPDFVVDNLPHATYEGGDAQLDKAIEYLKEQIKLHPVEIPKPPPYPDKSFKYNK